MSGPADHLRQLRDLVLASEDWLMERILYHALRQGYSKYTATEVEAWRLSIAGLTTALSGAIDAGRENLELSPDEDCTSDSIASFAVTEARLHRQRGISLAMFLGLMKYYRQAYLDLLEQDQRECSDPAACRNYLHRFFDRLEIAFCAEWCSLAGDDHLHELQAENRRMTNEKNLYLSALESHPDAVLVADVQGRIRMMNQQAAQFLNLRPLPGSTYSSATIRAPQAPADKRPELLTELLPALDGPFHSVLASGERLELTLLPQNGRLCCRTALSPMLDFSRKFHGVLVSMADISRSAQAYRQLQQEQTARHQAEQRLYSVLQAAEQMGLVETAHDDKHSIIAFSHGMARMSGYSAEEVLGHSPFEFLFDPGDAKQLAGLRTRIIQSREPCSQEIDLRKKDGRILHTLVTINPIWDAEHRQVHSFLSVIIDISERKQLEKQLLLSEKMASVAGLAAGVAHEINTPLSAILQSLQIIEEGISPDLAGNQEMARSCALDLAALHNYFTKQDLPFFLNGIRSAAENASRIVSNLLQFSRPSDNKQVRVDIHALIDTALALAKSDYQLKKTYNLMDLEIDKHFHLNLPELLCVPQEIEQVLINLFKNSIQALAATPAARRRLSVYTDVQGGMLSIAIADRGCGMDQTTQRRIFDPFFTTKEVGQGTGLGLTVCHMIVSDHHHGQILVDSEPGLGSCFTVLLPLHGVAS